VFQALAGHAVVDWLFMLGLLGVGVALILGVALRPAAVAGSTMLLLMYLASWPFAAVAAGQPTGSTNPIVDDHLIDTGGAHRSCRHGRVEHRGDQPPLVRSRLRQVSFLAPLGVSSQGHR